MLEHHRQLYNAALEHRIQAYRRAGETVGKAEQMRELTALRREVRAYARYNAQSQQVTLERVDGAYRSFFRRVREGAKKPGFPRFKSKRSFRGWGYKTHGDGWRLTLPEIPEGGKRPRTARLRLSGIGELRLRGRDRNGGTPKVCSIVRRHGVWYASVAFECVPLRTHGEREAGLDWGVETFATLAHPDGSYSRIENPRLFQQAREKLTAAQQELSKRKKGSKSREKARQRVRRLHRHVADRRQDFLHKASHRLIAEHARVATEELAVERMTRSARGTLEQPGTQVAQKAGLNRAILDTAPATFLSLGQYKAAEAGMPWEWVPTRKAKPSQRCHHCWTVPKRRKMTREGTSYPG
jgi:putative transposase